MNDIRVNYCGRELLAERGQRLLTVLLDAGEEHRHICGGNGFCTSCRVEVLSGAEGLCPVTPIERERLGADAGRLRLACQATVTGPVALRVPAPGSHGFSPFD